MTRTRLRTAGAATALTLALLLTGCAGQSGTDAGSAPAASADAAGVNETDVWFAQMMIVHHEGAVEMAELAVEDATTDEVRELAERIRDAQGPEIELMQGWLDAWGEPEPAGMDHGGMDHGGMDMEGMDQQEAMASLEGLDGLDVDRSFLDLMIAHHRGAVEMSEVELADGSDPAALDLAEQIIEDQEAEIAEMEDLLRGL
ncbi:DUF305 domain-containing protein [Cellulomonas oligotrophica]|uniref:Uncharacterized protein (DUF305 family) n=1 Tax=Cellulomonas oligotrophica TaxID=931536 RepID=A0A7Y9JYJ7_9CELL|nr:DUF305 domain-containing protein [Cellulomonas oligotrophica]NYD86991.1 uncharacterized protein (DUF305 family) [Cellulomonas oligotrophica]GIG32223.1 hypothetical protein Col01nite_13820 [Cellulomonas oligotrophica]